MTKQQPTDNRPKTIPPPIAGLTFDIPRIMGVLNITPDSFSDGGQFISLQQAVDRACVMAEQGADLIDIGGESTRPGAKIISVQEELDRILPVIEACNKAGLTTLSIDTRKAEVMSACLDLGIALINDVSALTYDEDSINIIAKSKIPVVLMHAQGTPQTMQDKPTYNDVVSDICNYLKQRIDACTQNAIPKNRIIIDPGIGFGKTLNHNLAILANLERFHDLGCAILLGASRKSFIAKIDGSDTNHRLGGSLAAVAKGYAAGIHFFRVHDVAETRQMLDVLTATENTQ